MAVRGIFFIELFPNWTACSPITYTKSLTRERFNLSLIIILAWELLRSYPKHKVNIFPRKITRILLPQVTEIDVIGPFSAKSPTTSPYFKRAGASAGNLVYMLTNIWKVDVQQNTDMSEVARDVIGICAKDLISSEAKYHASRHKRYVRIIYSNENEGRMKQIVHYSLFMKLCTVCAKI